MDRPLLIDFNSKKGKSCSNTHPAPAFTFPPAAVSTQNGLNDVFWLQLSSLFSCTWITCSALFLLSPLQEITNQ